MSPSVSVAGVEIKVSGQALDPALAASLLGVRLESHLLLPDAVSIRIADQTLEHIDSAPFEIGADLDVTLAAPDAAQTTTLFRGVITTFEPEFTEREVILAIRGYDRSHMMNRIPNTATYQDMSYSDIAGKLAASAGLSGGTIDSTGRAIDFVQQTNETDWAFLWRLATAIGYELLVDGRKLHFRRPKRSADTTVALTWGRSLLSFRPRVSGIQQVSSVRVRGWDPETQQAIVGEASRPELSSSIGVDRSKIVSSMGGGTLTVVDQPVGSQSEAESIAESVAARLANAYVEADGVAIGDARLRAGAAVKVDGVGTRFGGTYTLTEAVHVIRPGGGYHTQFGVSGRAIRSLRDLSSPPPSPSWRNSVVVGVVTNNNDPKGLGRVRVKYPVLDDNNEGWWARITAPSAGANRGLLMMPVVGDEVLLAFEHEDDEHPYVIGSLWNGKAKPQTLVHNDGSLAFRSDHQLIAQAAELISIKGDQAVTLESATDTTVKATGKLTAQSDSDGLVQSTTQLALKGTQAVTVQGSQATIQGDATTKVSGGSELSIESGGSMVIRGSSIQIQSAGPLQISAPQILLG